MVLIGIIFLRKRITTYKALTYTLPFVFFGPCFLPYLLFLGLSLSLPTSTNKKVGTNLTKIDCFGAKCSIFDVGGKMRNLWERYYDDCDAVIFCWKLGDDPDADEDGDGEGDSDNDEDEKPFDLSQQQEILNEVRQAISDDVPFLIFGHIFGSADLEVTSKQYSTNPVMPRYHNPLCGLVCGSAKTGAGVVSAMEWLIPLAKRQQKERLQQKEQNKKI